MNKKQAFNIYMNKKQAKKTKAKKGVFFKNKKIANNSEDLFTKMLGGK